MGSVPAAAILDVDGTLVDTNYQHALAWYRAFRRHEIVLPVWRIHRSVGMGGDQLVSYLCGERVERELGDDIRAAEGECYGELIDEVEPMEDAAKLIAELKRRKLVVVLASSAKAEEVERYVDMLGARELADGWTTSADVDATKPEPDLVGVALEKAGLGDDAAGAALMVGDSVWDCEAAKRIGVATVGLLTGGFSESELREAGARAVFESVTELHGRLGELPVLGDC
jgi:HAD superfamily hydrolase (TIGR01509 family)